VSKSKKKVLPLILKKFINPIHLARVIRLQRNRKKVQRVYDDAQLKLYHQILPGDYLHYGYFDDPTIHPLDITINMIYKAQDRYAEKLLELVTDTRLPILDIGCGMGGLLGMMNKKGWTAIGLTPDKNQAYHIRNKYPNTLLECKFEELDSSQYKKHFGTVITSESLQYLQTDIALPLIDKILIPGGKWVACDYFRIGNHGEKSGHNWDAFVAALDKYGFKITVEIDITSNILPTIAYVHHWGANIFVPVKNFGLEKLKVKAPGIYYAVEEAIPVLEEKIQKNIDTVDPKIFAANKRYVLLVMERK
jgi:cyclopropane fatty-acyl-phospholipid synthase-like methyltransferase